MWGVACGIFCFRANRRKRDTFSAKWIVGLLAVAIGVVVIAALTSSSTSSVPKDPHGPAWHHAKDRMDLAAYKYIDSGLADKYGSSTERVNAYAVAQCAGAIEDASREEAARPHTPVLDPVPANPNFHDPDHEETRRMLEHTRKLLDEQGQH